MVFMDVYGRYNELVHGVISTNKHHWGALNPNEIPVFFPPNTGSSGTSAGSPTHRWRIRRSSRPSWNHRGVVFVHPKKKGPKNMGKHREPDREPGV